MKINALSYHLGLALIQLIKNADASLIHRLNLVSQIAAYVKAMDDKTKFDDINTKLLMLRESYEPEMDIGIESYLKKIAFEIELDNVQIMLLKTVNKQQLVSSTVMQEIMVGSWK